jgi:beta-N-acetylhexosaminidase
MSPLLAILTALQKVDLRRCASSLVIAAYVYVRLVPQPACRRQGFARLVPPVAGELVPSTLVTSYEVINLGGARIVELQERVSELIMVGFFGQELDAALADHLCTIKPSGLIFFRRNVVSPEQVARFNRDIQRLAIQELGRPLLLAIDQEGGTVARLTPPFSQIPDAKVLGAEGPEAVGRYARLSAQEMRLVGLNLNFAPVLDVNLLESAGPMERRSFGRDPARVAECGVAAITAIQQEGVMATAKHFPGLGRAQEDPHLSLPVVPATREELLQSDLVPFRDAFRAGVACAMTSHILYPALDQGLPGTLSGAILTGLLRNDLGFEGVLISDDLDMGAVTSRYPPEWATLTALQAGVDLLLVCNDREHMNLVAEALHEGISLGLLDSDQIARSLARVEGLRRRYVRGQKFPDPDEVAAHFDR